MYRLSLFDLHLDIRAESNGFVANTTWHPSIYLSVS